MNTDRWLTIKQVADLLGKNPVSFARWVRRNRTRIDLQGSFIGGRENRLLISLTSLIRAGIIQSGTVEQSEGNQLLGSSIVRKGFADLSETESSILLQIHSDFASLKRSDLVNRMAQALGVSRAWLYRDHTLDARREKDSALEKMSAPQRSSVLKLFLQRKTTKRFIEDCCNDDHLPDYSPRTWYRVSIQLRRQYSDEVKLLNEGPVTFKQSLPPVLRDRTYLKPLEAIVGDFWRVDRATRWFDGEIIVPQLCVWVDWRTNLIVGTALTKTPNSLGVKTALYDCFIHHGIPFNAYMDNGKEFKAARISGGKVEEINVKGSFLTQVDSDIKKFHHRGILPSLGIRDLRASFKSPAAKTVERAFGRGGFTDWAKEFADWVGASYWERPEWVSKRIYEQRKNKRQRTFVNELSGEAFEFTDMFALAASIQAFIEHHNTRESKGFGMDGLSPVELWKKETGTTPPRRADVYDLAFAFLEGPDKPLKVRKSGYIEFKRDMFYFASRVWNHRLDRVLIRYNPIDGFWWARGDDGQHEFLPKSLMVYDQEGKFIDEATFVDRLDPLEAPPEKLKEALERKYQPMRDAKETIRDLSRTGQVVPVVDTKTPPTEVVKQIEEEKAAKEEEAALERTKRHPWFSDAGL